MELRKGMPDEAVLLEDVVVGQVSPSHRIAIREEDVLAFARLYDPQPMHSDPVAAAAGPFGGIIASGWQTPALIMRELVLARPFGDTPILGMGVDDLRWLRPVRPGDTLEARWTVIEAKENASRPGRGLVRTLFTATNQKGETVIQYVTRTSIPARSRR